MREIPLTAGTWRGRTLRLGLVLVASLAITGRTVPGPLAPSRVAAAATEDVEKAEPGHPVLGPQDVYVPSTVDSSRPVPVLLGLHGMGGSGPRIAARLSDCATANGWVLVTPTVAYRDYMDPEQVRLDDEEVLPRLREMLDDLPARVNGLTLDPETFVYGFSRGAQAAHRLALFYPDRVAGVAVLAAGSYTLPRTSVGVGPAEQTLRFPFGVADLRRYAGHAFDPGSLQGMPFWIGVGAADTVPEQVPPSWSPYLGTTRVERARRFSELLQSMGADVSLNVFSGAGHEETALMRTRACDFLAAQTPVHQH